MGNEQIFDGKKVYNISKEDQEVTIAKPNGTEKHFRLPIILMNTKRLHGNICWQKRCFRHHKIGSCKR
jgi:hypothetical protein